MNCRIRGIEDWGTVAKLFLDRFSSGGAFGLVGELGVGKTTFVRAIINELAPRQAKLPARVLSPSFVLHQNYSFDKACVDHFDFYRLNELTEESLLELGYWEAFERCQASSQGYLFVEWPEKAQKVDLRLSNRVQFLFQEFSEGLERVVIV